jgi:ribosomal protein S3
MRHLQESQYILYNGWKIGCFGRFKRTGRARKMWYGKIGVPLNTLTANIDYAKSIVRLRNGLCCIKVFITRTSVYSYLI